MAETILLYRLAMAIAGISLGIAIEVVFWCAKNEAFDLAAGGIVLGAISANLIVLLIGGELWPI